MSSGFKEQKIVVLVGAHPVIIKLEHKVCSLTLATLIGIGISAITFDWEREVVRETDDANCFIYSLHTTQTLERCTWGFLNWIPTPGIVETGPAPPGPSRSHRKRSPISSLAAGWALCFGRGNKGGQYQAETCGTISSTTQIYLAVTGQREMSHLSDRFHQTCINPECRLL